MLKRTIITSSNKALEIVSDDEVIIDWFNRPAETHTDIIIEQLNTKMYERFFNGKSNMNVIDVGANIGLWTLYAYDSCSKIVAVEPAPHNFYILEALTKSFPNVELDMSALSNSNSTTKMNIHTSPTCNSIVNATDTDLAIDVETKTIETIMRDHNMDYVDFIKCDIESGEMLAITAETLNPVKDCIGSWLIECHQTDGDTGAPWPGNLESNRQQIMSILRDAGYQTESIIHDQIYAWK